MAKQKPLFSIILTSIKIFQFTSNAQAFHRYQNILFVKYFQEGYKSTKNETIRTDGKIGIQ
ncbi:MAG: hypothetical protein HYY40_00480 [Bacteroidetes bacterium]|nr:hypothetical protein [Bacteroidota bacterium]